MLNAQKDPLHAIQFYAPQSFAPPKAGAHDSVGFCCRKVKLLLASRRLSAVMALRILCLWQVRQLFRDALVLLREEPTGAPARTGAAPPPTWALVQADGASRTAEGERMLCDSFPLLGRLFTVESILRPKLNPRAIQTVPSSTPKTKVRAVPVPPPPGGPGGPESQLSYAMSFWYLCCWGCEAVVLLCPPRLCSWSLLLRSVHLNRPSTCSFHVLFFPLRRCSFASFINNEETRVCARAGSFLLLRSGSGKATILKQMERILLKQMQCILLMT